MEGNAEAFTKRLSSLGILLKKEPYRSAFRNVDSSLMKKSWKMICKFINKNQLLLAYVCYKLKSIKDSIQR